MNGILTLSSRCTVFVGLLAIIGLSLPGKFSLAQEAKPVSWTEVDEAINQGLPQTAIERLGPIIESTKASSNFDAAVKAVCLKISLEGEIQGNQPEEKIMRLRAQIDQSPDPMKPVMEAILANWYWHYFQQNRWRYLQRTQTDGAAAEAIGDDITTWDLARILDKIRDQFSTALAAESMLRSTPVQQYRELLEGVDSSVLLRPTLYDVLAHNAIDFYSSGEQAGAAQQDAFEISADGPALEDVEAFMRWQPDSADSESLKLAAVKQFQALLRFHQNDEDRSAFLDNDLLRLIFAENHAFGESKTQRFQSALRRFANSHSENPISARCGCIVWPRHFVRPVTWSPRMRSLGKDCNSIPTRSAVEPVTT